MNSASVENIAVGGNMQGNITVGNENVVGDHNVIYKVHTEKGAVVNLVQGQPPVRPRAMRGQPLSPPPDFVDRESDLAQISSFIREKKPVLVYGPDGIGKTALLAQASNSNAARAMPDGVVSVEGIDEAGKLLGLDDVVQRLFDALFESNPPLKVTFPTARIYLSNTQPLVIIDPLNLPVDALNRLPNLFPTGALLVSCQDAPLDNRYRSLPVRPLARKASLQLFSNVSGIPLDETTLSYMDEICELLGDVPLAIVKTAAIIRQRDLALEAVPQPLAAIQTVSQNKIQAAIERSIKWIESVLDEQEENMLAIVAAAPGNSVERLWVESQAGGEATSQNLESFELLYANGPRLRLPDGIRPVLKSSGKGFAERRETLLNHLLQELESRSRDLGFVESELGNLLGLLEWAVEEERWADVVTLGRAVDPYLTLHGLWDAWEWVLQQVLAAGQHLKDLAVRGWALHQLGTREIGVGTRNKAIGLLQRAMRIRISQGDMVGAAYTLNNLNLILPQGTKEDGDGTDSTKKHAKTDIPDYPGPFWERIWGFLDKHFWIVVGAVITAVVAGLLLPSLHMSVQASPMTYNPLGQVIEYTYRVSGGLLKLSGPIYVTTQDEIRVNCPDLDTVGNGDGFLDWNETITCSGFYKITERDVQNDSVKHTAVASAGDSGPHSRPESITIQRGDRYAMMRIETNPTTFRNAGEIIQVAYIISGVGNQPLGGRVSVAGETLQANCPDIQKIGDGNGFLDLGERLACTASYTITDADVQAGQWTTTASVSVGNFRSNPQSVTIFKLVPPALVLKKSAQPETYQDLGQQIRYTYEVTNQGGEALNGLVEVIDDQVDVTCAGQNDVLEPGETRTCQAVYTINAADLDRGSLTNTATARVGDTESEPQSVTIVRAPPAYLVLKKSAEPKTYQAPGQQIHYTYEVRNEGKDPIDGSVEVSDDRVEVTCGEQDGVLEPGELLICNGTYSIDATDLDRGSLTNTARASAGSVRSPEASVTISFEPVLPVLVKSANPTTYHQDGERIDYTYVITNPGGLPIGVPVYVEDDNKVTVDCTEIDLTDGSTIAIVPGETFTCTGTYTITAEDIQNESVTNTAVAVVGDRTSEPTSVTIYYETGDDIPILKLQKSAEPKTYQQEGQQIQYMYFIVNEGKIPFKGQVRVEDGKMQVNCPGLGEIGDDDEVFDPGERLTCAGTYLITKTDLQVGSVTNNARAWVGDIYSNLDSFTILEKAVRLEKAANPLRYQAVNDQIQYSYTVTGRNRVPLPGPATISDDRVQQVICTPLNQLGNGDDFLDWDEKVPCAGGYTITQADIDPPDLNNDHGSLTNTAVASVGGVQSNASSLTIQGPGPDHNLLLEKAATPDEYDTLGQAIAYTYKMSNVGNMTLFAPFTVTDDHIDNGVPFPCGEDTLRLAPGEFINCSSEYTIAQTDFNFGNSSVTNQAFATGHFQEEPVQSSPVSATVACPYPPGGWVPYQVEAGETLVHISTWYPGTPMEELQRLNCMGGATEVTGQTLYLPENPPPAVLTGYVFTDPNRNMVWEDGEVGVAGVPVTIVDATGLVAGRTTTGANGQYSFFNLGSGPYSVFQYRVTLRRGETVDRSFGIAPSLP